MQQAAIEHIATLLKQLRRRGFSDHIPVSQWGKDLWERRHVVVHGVDRSILEITYANVYIRVVADPRAAPETPFAVARYVSYENADRPKTEFYLQDYLPEYMSAEALSGALAIYCER
jgi:hypothetical protein